MDIPTQNQNIRVRIAPSPTGALHVGTAHTALFNFLFAKRYGGTFVLRIEDTDAARSTKEWEQNILQGLEWLGITWDEGLTPDGAGEMGEFGPYRQSERTESYKQYLEKLLAEGKAFYCWHSKEELEREKNDLQARGEVARHICAFRDFALRTLTDEQKNKSNIRFKNTNSLVRFNDLIRGDIEFDAKLLEDFSLARSLESPLYNFAVVVDDYTTKITHVIRGADHVSNTPRQIMIQEALGFPRPAYAHLPLLLGKDRSKLSKRHAATSVFEYKEAGYLSQAFFNFLTLLGYTPEGGEEVLTPRDLIKTFSLERVQKSNAIFDSEKLDWINGIYIRKMNVEELTALCIPYLVRDGLLLEREGAYYLKNDAQKRVSVSWLEKIVALEQERMKRLTDIVKNAQFFFQDPRYEWELLRWKKMSQEDVQKSIDWTYHFLDALPEEQFQDAKLLEQRMMAGETAAAEDRGAVLWPLRVALTGEKASPSPFDIMAILGKEKTLARIQQAKNLLQ